VIELRDLLAPYEASSLSPTAVCVDLLATPLSSVLSTDADPGIELAKRVIYYRQRKQADWASFLREIDEAFIQMALRAEAHAQGEGEAFAMMGRLAEEWRKASSQFGLMAELARLAETSGADEAAEQIDSLERGGARLDDIHPYAHWVTGAFEDIGQQAHAASARELEAAAFRRLFSIAGLLRYVLADEDDQDEE
jgi:hypothetical protein